LARHTARDIPGILAEEFSVDAGADNIEQPTAE